MTCKPRRRSSSSQVPLDVRSVVELDAVNQPAALRSEDLVQVEKQPVSETHISGTFNFSPFHLERNGCTHWTYHMHKKASTGLFFSRVISFKFHVGDCVSFDNKFCMTLLFPYEN